MEYAKTILTTLGGFLVSFFNLKLMMVNITQQIEVFNGLIGIVLGILSVIYLVYKIVKIRKDEAARK